MICPVLERLQAMEGGDASDGAGTGTEIDEVRGGLRAHPSGWLEPGGGGGGSGCLGAHLPALARPLRGGGSRRSLRPPPGPPLGAARAGGRGGAGAGVVRHPLLGLHGQALPREAGGRSRLQAQLQLAAAELASPWAQARGAQAWGAPAQAAAPCPARHDVAPGRLEPRVGPRSMVGPDRHHGRCDQRYLLGLLRRRRGHHVEPPGVSEAIRAKGLFCSLYADRASHYWNTPEAGGKVDKDTPTQVGRALAQLGIELIPAYSPEARGRSERMFGTLQKRLPQELRLAGITDMVEANRFLKEVFLPQHNARFATPAEDRGTAFVPFTGALDDILCIHEERTVSNDNTVRYKRLALQIPAGRHRRHYVKARVRVHEYPDGTMAVFHGPRCLARYHADGQPIDSQTREAA